MDIKDSYLHGTVGVVKSISVDADKLKYKLADIAGTIREVTLPLVTTTANGLMSSTDKIKLDNLSTTLGNYVTLNTDQEITGIKTFTKQLKFTVAKGTAPFLVTSTTKVINLNTDLIDGYDSEHIMKDIGWRTDTNLNNLKNVFICTGEKSGEINAPSSYGNLVSFRKVSDDGYGGLLLFGKKGLLYYRCYWDNTWDTWKRIAFTNSNITGNAASADKLKTKRKLWGLDFDGTADVSGNMTGVGNIIIPSSDIDRFISFTTVGNTHNWRLGYTGSGAGEANYLIFQSTKTATPADGWYDALKFGCETLTATFGGNVIAPTFQGNLDGTYVNKLTNYTIATAIGSIATTDSLNTALGKLEFKTNFIYNDLFGTDNDDVINKWHEIVDFIDSVKEGTDITNEFVTRKTALTITGIKTFSSLQKFTVADGTSPFTVTSTTKVDNLNADTLDGFHATMGSSKPWGKISAIGTDGVIELGRYIDLHYDNTTGSDYSTRLQVSGNHSNVVNLPSSSGTLALTSQLPTKVSWNYDDRYLKLSGGTMVGSIILKGSTSPDMTYGGNIHPYIRFDNANSDQNVSLIFTDHDTYRSPAGIKLIGNQGGEWFEAPNIYATNFYGNEFKKNGSSNDYVLLGGGGHKTISSIITEGYIGTTLVLTSSKVQALSGISSINGRVSISAENDLTRIGFGGVHAVAFGEPGYAHRNYYFRPSYGTPGVTYTKVYIQNASASASPTWTTTHIFDFNGDAIHSGSVTSSGFKKNGSDNSYVLLGGGGHKLITDFAISNHIHNIYAINENYGGFKKSERLPTSGFYESHLSESGDNSPWAGWMHLINCLHSNTSNNYALLIVASFFDNNTFKIRVTNNNVNNAWRNIIHSGNYNSYSPKLDGTGASGTWNININGNSSTASRLKSIIVVDSKAFNLSNASWTDTGYTFTSLATGTYVVQVTFGDTLVASGIMSVYNNLSDTAGDEIPLHVYGTAGWRPYLRTYANKLLISSNDISATSRTITIKIALIL